MHDLAAIDYTNWRGERSWRLIQPKRMLFGSSKYHPATQWLMEADCLDRDPVESRHFAMASIHQMISGHEAEEAFRRPAAPKRPVLQDWALRISLMQQSVLLGIIRGPDGVQKYHPVKPVLRWYRRCLLLSALDGEVIDNPYDQRGGSFTGPSCPDPREVTEGLEWEDLIAPKVDQFFTTMDQMPIHYWLHMTHAVEIMGYHHSEQRIRVWWRDLYMRMVAAMHLFPESKTQLNERLGDTREGWLARSDKAITK